MRTHRKTTQLTTDLERDLSREGLCEVAIAHDRYTVAFHVTSCQIWVVDGTGHDAPRGPFLACRQAWAEALDLNARTAQDTETQG
jgi:hypothetical protein